MVGELGLFCGFVLMYALFKRLQAGELTPGIGKVLVLFVGALFVLDNWHDSPFLFFLLVLLHARAARVEQGGDEVLRASSLRQNF